jgi:hypothetical protein
MALELRERNAQARTASSTVAEAATEFEQMPLFARVVQPRQT